MFALLVAAGWMIGCVPGIVAWHVAGKSVVDPILRDAMRMPSRDAATGRHAGSARRADEVRDEFDPVPYAHLRRRAQVREAADVGGQDLVGPFRLQSRDLVRPQPS
jgi:hypothetical protein